ncbi:MAG TPA: hypothetical protein VMS64_23010 [Candidatus Methylomirabilis sp.]|nr:hypothetical protein [Candidatus Methylomirabilis sp.]
MVLGTGRRGRWVGIAAIILGSFLAVCAAARLDDARAAAAWSTLGGNSQHTGLSTSAAQSLEVIHWSTPVELAPPSGSIIHYGSPLVTSANTVIIPVKNGAGYRVDARAGKDGSLVWSTTTDYVIPPHGWTPSYSPALAPNNRVYFAGAGGTVYYRDNADGIGGVTQLAFYGLAVYQANRSSLDSTVFVNTPITVDSGGNIYFGFRTSGTNPLGLQSGIARIGTDGSGFWISATTAAGGDTSTTQVPHQAAPALSNDERTLYVVVAGANSYLVGLDPATLNAKEVSLGVPMRVALKDPRNGGTSNAWVTDDSSASPMVGPDGDVYYGVLGSSYNGSRGFLLHFSGDLTQTKTPGAFGWDNTAAVVPVSAVPSYQGSSTYLIFSKYNNYAGLDGGDGVNKVAVLDPNATQVESHPSSNGLLVMKEILTIAGPTPDPALTAQFPQAVREWCINAAAVDPFTQSVMVNSEDGKLYRWHLPSNTLSQAVTLSSGIGEAYTPTVIGTDGTVYAINQAVLDAVGQRPTSGTGLKTFTVLPCRVVDTRVAGGVIPAGGSRNFHVAGTLSDQGGASDCQVPFPGAKGAYINVVAVWPSGSGFLTVYPYPLPMPLASTLNFSTGQTIANGLLVPICDESTADCTGGDITLTMGSASAHIVIDVTGYVQALP